MYRQILDPVAHSLAWSSLVAVVPLATLFVMLGVLRIRAWTASVVSLAVAIAIAVAVYGMPIGQAALAGSEGAAFGFFPILWIVINAIWVYQMTVETGHFDVLRRSFAAVSDDHRIQAIIIAFSFGALLEALAGFGTPVAVTSVMLLALGFKPLKAAVLALVANTAPVAYGAMATPIITLAKTAGLPTDTLGAMVGRQTPILALFVPLALVGIADGLRGVRETWLIAFTGGVVFGLGRYATSNFVSVPLADVTASLLSAGAVVAMVRVRPPQAEHTRAAVPAGGAADAPAPEFGERVANPDSRGDVLRAYAPYAIVIAVFVICQISAVKKLLDHATFTVHWPGLHLYTAKGTASTLPNFTFNLLTTPGTQMLVAGILTMVGAAPVADQGAQGLRRDAAPAALGHRDGNVCAGTGFRDERVRTDHHPGHLDGRNRGRVRADLPDTRLARCGSDGVRHLLELPVRRTASDRGGQGGTVPGSDGRRQQLRRRARQDDLAAEPRHRRRGGRGARQRGRHLPSRVHLEPGIPGIHL